MLIRTTRKKFTVIPVLKIFWDHTKRYRLLLFGAFFFGVLVHVVDVIIPLFYKRLFDTLAESTPSPEAAEVLVGILVAALSLHFLSWGARRVSQFSNVYLQPKVMDDLSRSAFSYLLDHSYDFFVNNFTGSLVRRVSRLSRSFEDFMDRLLYDLLPLLVSLIGIIIVLLLQVPLLGVVFLAWVVALMTLQFFIARWKMRYNLMIAEKDSEVTGVLSDAIANDTTIKLFTGKEKERSLFQKVSEELRRLRIRGWRFDEIVNLTQGVFTIGIEFLLIYASIRLWERGIISIGDFVLVQAYLINAVGKLWNFGGTLRRIYMAFADATEMVEIMNLPHGVRDKPTATVLSVSSGEIEFRDVGFSFRQTHEVLRHFSLKVAAKEKIALVGPSGAGKTTVTKLLFRFYEVTENGIYIDGQNIADVTQESLRKTIALVPQEPVLFHRTLRENIRYGRLGASEEEGFEAARKAHCLEFIERLPYGFDTYVGERGIKLSGGERQRVAIARAVLKDAPILVLDEATSSLDSESEALIQDALGKLMEGKTVIVIAHRLSTVMKMDRIVVMDKGIVVTEGTHEELLRRQGGLYKKLWEIQAGGFLSQGDEEISLELSEEEETTHH